MSIDTSGPLAVQARIAAIQSRFAQAPLGAGGAPGGLLGGDAASAAGSTSFASVLDALGTGSDASNPGTDPTLGGVDGYLGAAGSAGSVGGAAGSTGSSSAPTGDQVVADARRYLGVPYVWGGTDPAKGLDCSGLVQRVYADLGITLPRVSQDQARAGTAVPSLAQAKPGDLLGFGSPADHIGIYIGNNKMIVAPKAGDVVKVQSVYQTPSSIRRILPGDNGIAALAETSGTSAAGGSGTGGPALAAAPAAYRQLFQQAGSRYGVSPALLAAVAKVESGFNPGAVSGAGAQGLMQLMPGTARSLGVDPTNPAQAVDGAARLLAGHLRTFGSVPLALAAYNAGPGAVSRYGGIPPYAETQSYVQKVLAAGGAA